MGNLPQVNKPDPIPITLATPGYLMEHHFQGKPVLPAVEAMEALARIAKKTYPQRQYHHLKDVSFEKFLFLEANCDQLEAITELKTLEDGCLEATLRTRVKSPKAAFTRTKTHVRLCFTPSEAPPYDWPLDRASALEGICTVVPPEKIYRALVPFGPTFRNIQAPLFISPDGAIAHIQTPRQRYHDNRESSLLGSGYALDAAFHAACVWAQHYCGIVAFPVAVGRRRIIEPTCPEKTYTGRIIPKTITDALQIFDILLMDESGKVCETVESVEMRDVSGGRLQPPDWIKADQSLDPFTNIKKVCREMAIVELDAVTAFAENALSSEEQQRYLKMGARRRKSFIAARMALKYLFHHGSDTDCATPSHQIDTVCEGSPLPCIGNENSGAEEYCSVSHDRRFAIAVANRHAVGVDVEVISTKALKAGRIFMNKAEQTLVAQSQMEDTSAAVRIWSVKEAVAKAMGINLADTWEQVQVTAVDEEESHLKIGGETMTAQHATVDGHLFTLIVVQDTKGV